MNKKVLRFLIFIIMLGCTFLMCDNVMASEVTCHYHVYDELGAGDANKSLDVEVVITDGNPKAIINRYGQKTDMKKSKKVKNWPDVKETYSSSGNCPSHIMVTKGLAYNVYLAYNQAALEKIAANKKINENKLIIATEKGYNGSNTELVDQKYKDVEELTDGIEKAADNFDINECMDKEKVITRIKECRDLYKSNTKLLDEFEKRVRTMISEGYISEDDPRVQAFFKALEEARKKWEKAKKQIDEEDEKIKEELGLKEGGNSKTSASTWNSADGNTNKFLKKVWGMLKVIVPVLVIVLSIADFLKVLIISDEKNYKEAYTRLLKRIAVGIILFVLPALIKLVLDLAGLQDAGIFEVFS